MALDKATMDTDIMDMETAMQASTSVPFHVSGIPTGTTTVINDTIIIEERRFHYLHEDAKPLQGFMQSDNHRETKLCGQESRSAR